MIRVLREAGGRKPGRSDWMARRLAMPLRTARWYLLRLEGMGLVKRPAGKRGGWSYCAEPFDARLLATLRRCERYMQGPVSSKALAQRLGIPNRTVRHHLLKLEKRGCVYRPGGERSGYRVTINKRAWRLLETLAAESQVIYRTVEVAALCRIPRRTARHYLARLETLGAVYRPYGPKSGWMVA